MPSLPRFWPAIDLRLRDQAGAPPDLDDRVALAIDDVEATAVEQSDTARQWRAHFSDAPARDAAAAMLRDSLGPWMEVAVVDVEDEGWAIRVQEDLRSVRVGDVVVAPPWDVPRPPPGQARPDIVIVIEPSMGFGTGHHQSTRLCLALLQQLPLTGLRVIDVGTGSGVLALAARRLGAAEVLALDNDADSVAAARDNLQRNGGDAAVRVHQVDVADAVLAPADVVTANLTAWLLRRCRDPLAALVAPTGLLLTSGFTTDQTPLVLDAFPDFAAVATLEEDEWVALTLRRRW